jgi:hypothetical protein
MKSGNSASGLHSSPMIPNTIPRMANTVTAVGRAADVGWA